MWIRAAIYNEICMCTRMGVIIFLCNIELMGHYKDFLRRYVIKIEWLECLRYWLFWILIMNWQMAFCNFATCYFHRYVYHHTCRFTITSCFRFKDSVHGVLERCFEPFFLDTAGNSFGICSRDLPRSLQDQNQNISPGPLWGKSFLCDFRASDRINLMWRTLSKVIVSYVFRGIMYSGSKVKTSDQALFLWHFHL